MKAIDKAIKLTRKVKDKTEHLNTYKGWNLSWDISEGVVNASKKGVKFTAVNEKEALKEIDRRGK